VEKITKKIRPTFAITSMSQKDWASLGGVLVLAMVLRILFYTGPFGSDEVTYIATANRIASGDWLASNYVGATRYGMNLPLALSIYLFGLSEASVNLWPFFCSIGEVAIVFSIGRWLWGTRVAVVCASLLALLPLHVHFGGRMMADPPLAFFLTLSVALLLSAAHSNRTLIYLAAGLAWGGVFWIKESVGLLYLPVFLFLSVLLNGFNRRFLWLFASVVISVLGNLALMYFVAGNPLHVFVVMNISMTRADGMTTLATSPWYYLNYLFMDIRHSFLLGFLVLAGVVLYVINVFRDKQADSRTAFVIVWALLLVGMFSFAIVSFTPIKLVMKQTNYMLIFFGPLSLLAGWFLASLPRRVFRPLAGLIVCGSLVLAALERQAITVFTANGKAAYVFLRDNPNSYLIGTTNNGRMIDYFSLMENRLEIRSRFWLLGDMGSVLDSNSADNFANKAARKNIFAVLDLQTIDWGNKLGGIRGIPDVPKCWASMGVLTPASLGSGQWVVKGLVAAGSILPESMQGRYLSVLQPISTPAPAYMYLVDASCQ